jgi:hypothetical protein
MEARVLRVADAIEVPVLRGERRIERGRFPNAPHRKQRGDGDREARDAIDQAFAVLCETE